MQVVTSFSPAGAELYGRRCVDSVTAHWPSPLTVYADAQIAIPGVTVRLTTEIPGWADTQSRLPVDRRDAPETGTDQWTRKSTCYLWHAQRFAVKAFVWKDAAERLGSGLLVWLDGDTVTAEDVPDGLIEGVMAGVDVAYLGRGDMHPETGFVVFRIPEALPLLQWCCDTYTSGAFTAWPDGWTDCHVLRAGLKAVQAKARDLTSHTRGHWKSSVDAFALSPIGQYVKHLKGVKQKREAA